MFLCTQMRVCSYVAWLNHLRDMALSFIPTYNVSVHQNVCALTNGMGWLMLVGSIKLYVSFAKEPYRRDYILPKRPLILSILLTVATPYGLCMCVRWLIHSYRYSIFLCTQICVRPQVARLIYMCDMTHLFIPLFNVSVHTVCVRSYVVWLI